MENDAHFPQKRQQGHVQYRLIFLVLLGSAAEGQGDDDLAELYDYQVQQVGLESKALPSLSLSLARHTYTSIK